MTEIEDVVRQGADRIGRAASQHGSLLVIGEVLAWANKYMPQLTDEALDALLDLVEKHNHV